MIARDATIWGGGRKPNCRVEIAVFQGGEAIPVVLDDEFVVTDNQTMLYEFFPTVDQVASPPPVQVWATGNASASRYWTAAGGDTVSLQGYGLCDNSTAATANANFSKFACRFVSDEDASDYVDSPVAVATSLTSLNCTTPEWGAYFAHPNTSISLLVNRSQSSIDPDAAAYTPTVSVYAPSRVPLSFDCCVVRQVSVVAVDPEFGPAQGGAATLIELEAWNLPFDYAVVNDTELAVAFLVEGDARSSRGSPYLESSDSSGATVALVTPAGVGANLTLWFSFGGLPLLRFEAKDAYDYAAPFVDRVVNDTGPTEGAFNIMVFGRNFGGADFSPIVRIQNDNASLDDSCATTQYVNDTFVMCLGAPAGTGQNRPVFVEVGGRLGESNATFTYDFPVVTAVEGDQFSTEGGDTVTISGRNFGSDVNLMSVSIGGLDCAVTDGSNTLIECDLPAGTGKNLDLIVSIEAQDSEAVAFSYDAPTLSQLTPSSNADVRGGEQLVVHGKNFGTDEALIRCE